MTIPQEEYANRMTYKTTAPTLPELKAQMLLFLRERGRDKLIAASDMNRLFATGAAKLGSSFRTLIDELETEALVLKLPGRNEAMLLCSDVFYEYATSNAAPHVDWREAVVRMFYYDLDAAKGHTVK